MRISTFDEQYKNLNSAQKQAVDAIDGPVMVIAGPGTGKTQILALRIANILKNTDTPPDGILCLTFTNSGVRAMRERLQGFILSSSVRVIISTFHSFAMKLIQEFFEELGLEKPPTLLDDSDKILLYDELLEKGEWKRIRRRNGGEHNFDDLKSLISILKRERVNPEDFAWQVEEEIRIIKKSPESLSSRGKTKGELKGEILTKLEALERTREAAEFYKLYEKTKKDRNLVDYDDVLEDIVVLSKKSENVRDTLRERHLYILVDEHQDSSGVQNEFLESVWGGVEKPNLFVVGDDRQLIYGFGGASLSHFEKFKDTFPETKIIPLTQNYRSTQTVLDVAEKLLTSTIVKGGLLGSKNHSDPVELIEAEYPRDEILKAGLEIKKKIEEGLEAGECAILVPKQAQAKTAITILEDLGLPVASGGKTSFFNLPETRSLILLLRALNNPCEPSSLFPLLLDPIFGVSFLTAHKFLKLYGKKISLEDFLKGDKSVQTLGKILEKLAKDLPKKDVYSFIQEVSTEVFFKDNFSGQDNNHRKLISNIEMVRTMLHLALAQIEKNPKLTMSDFLVFLERMESYGEDIPLAVFSADRGVEVMTLHGSKGREFEFVWIAHMDENSLMKGKRLGISLPETLKEKVAKKDEDTARRELYVAVTRAKRFCTISYARTSYAGTDQVLANIVAELPQEMFVKKRADETEKEIFHKDKLSYVTSRHAPIAQDVRKEIEALTKAEYRDRPVSVTHINNFFSCPWKWYFRNFLQLPEPESESLKFGNLVHRGVEIVISKNVLLGDLPRIVTGLLDELLIYNDSERGRFEKDAILILERFIKEKSGEYSGAITEDKIKPRRDPDFAEIEVTGKIDVMKKLEDGTLLVADFKTGRVKKKSEIEKIGKNGRMGDMLRQLSMYSYLLGFDPKRGKVSRSQLLFLEAERGDKDVLYETFITQKHIDLLRKDLKDFVALLENGKWMDLPCDFKPFGRVKDCQYCKMSRLINLQSN